MPTWTRDGAILFSRLLPGARVAWEFQPDRPDTDHFNRDWKPELARGGTQICRLDPRNKSILPLTRNDPPLWDLRASESPSGRAVAFCRCHVGEMPSLWIMDPNGENQRPLSGGIGHSGADHPRWLPRQR
jgi:TolB protein